MLDSLYEDTLGKKAQIISLIDEYQVKKNIADKFWNKMVIQDENNGLTIAAVDGSKNTKEFIGFVIYAIDAECVIYRDKLLDPIKASDMGVLQPYRNVNDRLEFYMSVLELKVALEALRSNDIDLLLLDGSILSYLIKPNPIMHELSVEMRDKLIREYQSDLEEEIKKKSLKINSIQYLNEIEAKYPKKTIEAIIFLEYLEKLITVKELLNFKDNFLGISKTSRVNDYFRLLVPDQAIFEYNTKDPGYSRPLPIIIGNKVKRTFPIYNDLFRKLGLTMFFARLEKNSNMLKFEVPQARLKHNVEDLISMIKPVCTEGYPYLLKKAHHDVVIKHKDLNQLIKILGIQEKAGREML